MKYIIVLIMAMSGYGIIGGFYYRYSNHCFNEIIYAIRNGKIADESTFNEQNNSAERIVNNLRETWNAGLIGSISGIIIGFMYLTKIKKSAQQNDAPEPPSAAR